ncbi:MAG: stringent starvation protein A [Methylococcales bacterium]|jgi:stringent starvation protein A|nr:stringent starvation protein A [Methylococcales bacterium]MBT7445586.1 stringent starvation protein A [Methylococcales bacterium]
MAVVGNKRSVMTMYSALDCSYCHSARFVLAEKGIAHEIVNVDPEALPEDLIDLNPYSSVPTLVDRDLVLYHSRVIVEYLDERFPHPPLLPVDPVSRARFRLLMHRVDKDWYVLMDDILTKGEKKAAKARKMLRESLMSTIPVFEAKPYFMSDELSLVDCVIAPLLWRLPVLGIELSNEAKSIKEYAEKLFERESFQTSLTEAEREMRDN